MSTPLRTAFANEWASARAARLAGDLDGAFHHLERAHILSQRLTWLHVKSHLGMWQIGWLRSDWRELIGQSTRIVAALLFSRIWVPIGNTGGANVSPLRPMPVPEDLRAILEPERTEFV
ncbi:MAG: DUF3703 domain-containing protein [Xanthomonadales bacterium]|nr:DUF3703 domain-containing protein [Xanthomonadales bacterium]MCC6561872.1 DUF3703 domain-containing protein [Xanthomonadales bacterium]